MPEIIGDPNGNLELSHRALESTDYAVPQLWNDWFQKLLTNDAILNKSLDDLVALINNLADSYNARRFYHVSYQGNEAVDPARSIYLLAAKIPSGKTLYLRRMEIGHVGFFVAKLLLRVFVNGQTVQEITLIQQDEPMALLEVRTVPERELGSGPGDFIVLAHHVYNPSDPNFRAGTYAISALFEIA